MMQKSIFNWSGGKDSALALYHTQRASELSVGRLLTNINSTYNRVSMHGVREELVDQQAAQLGIPLQKVMISEYPSMDEYNELMRNTLLGLAQEGYSCSVFGDIFLEDLRSYREQKLSEVGFTAHFPLWKRATKELMNEFLDLGFKTITVCTNAAMLNADFCGREVDQYFLRDLPKNVDICGENGEFHTFVYAGPIFKNEIKFDIGEKVYREYKAPKSTNNMCNSQEDQAIQKSGFWFCDLIPN